MSSETGKGRKNGLRLIAVGLTILAIALAWSGWMPPEQRRMLVTLLALSLALVLFGSVAALSVPPSAPGAERPVRRVLAAALPVVVVAITAVLATTLYAISTVRVGIPTMDDPSIDWSAASETDLRIASVFGLVSERGVSAALDRLEELAAADEAIRIRGHGIAHAVGRYAIQNNGYDAAVFGECREIFQSGCYHGVLEAYFEGKPDVDAETVAGLCGSMVEEGRPPIEAVECAHGLGHGLTVRFAFDLQEALDRCDYLELEIARQECFDGVFMENAVHGAQPRTPGGGHQHGDADGGMAAADHAMSSPERQTDDMYRGMFRPGDPTYPCGEFDDRYQRACWAYQYMTVLRLNGDDIVAALDACDEAPALGTAACYLGLGKRIGWKHEERDDRLVEACALGDAEYFDDCIRGAMEYFMDTAFDADRALQLCSAVPVDSKEPCFRALGTRVGLVTTERDRVERICRGAADFATVCLAGALPDA